MKITVYVDTGYVGSRRESEIEIEDESLEGLSDDQQEEIIEEAARDAMHEMIDWGWEKEE